MDDTLIQNNAGLQSLSGFAFQIRVFMYHALSIRENEEIKFEAIDDVSIQRVNEIDKQSEKFLLTVKQSTNTAIQVKQTKVTKTVAQKVVLNWLLLENGINNIEKYILFTDETYDNKNVILNIDANTLFENIITSKKSPLATITKVKNLYGNDFNNFNSDLNAIKDKYCFVSKNIDNELYENSTAKLLFKKEGIIDHTYTNRIHELLSQLTSNILTSAIKKKPYILTYKNFMSICENISNIIRDNEQVPCFTSFKKCHDFNMNNSIITSSREYKQLYSCFKSEELIKAQIFHKLYYENYRFRYMEQDNMALISDIEYTSYFNFLNTKNKLQQEKSDTPNRRLHETMDKENSHAQITQIKQGSLIYLTKDDVDNQISWEDDDNAKS